MRCCGNLSHIHHSIGKISHSIKNNFREIKRLIVKMSISMHSSKNGSSASVMVGFPRLHVFIMPPFLLFLELSSPNIAKRMYISKIGNLPKKKGSRTLLVTLKSSNTFHGRQ